MNAALILAGGTGERLSEIGIPKQYYIIGKPVIIYSLLAFQECENISIISITASPNWQPEIKRWIEEYGISKFKSFALPGPTRQHSVFNGLTALCEIMNDNDFVIIHDAARPFVTKQDISRVIQASAGFDGATPVININDTVYQSKDKKQITALLNRDELFAGQTPECYNFGKYLLAHKRLSDEDIGNIRGSSEVAFNSGMNIGLCEGNIDNFKITTMRDLEYSKYRMGSI